jgi:SAM-dependent methyltransferase
MQALVRDEFQEGQVSQQTKKSFADKWNLNPGLAFENTLNVHSDIFKWIMTRNGFNDKQSFQLYLNDKKRILDAGCGNGRVTKLIRDNSDPNAKIVGIDLSSSHVAAKNLAQEQNVSFFEKDLLGDLSDLGKFDFIYSQEVLHHTDDPLQAFKNLTGLLADNGEIAIYVYKEKAPIREYTDEFVRGKIKNISYEDAMKVSRQFAELGKKLSDLNVTIDVPDVDILEIKSGTYDIQRFIYHFFTKCFWSNEMSAEDNAVVNYDWYHPQECSKHTLPEVKEWFAKCGLDVVHEHVDEYGVTVRGINK